MNVYIGNTNIASLYNDLRAGFEALGHNVFTMTKQGQTIQANSDLDLFKALEEEAHRFDRSNPNAASQVRDKYLSDYYQKIHDYACIKAAEADLCIFIWSSFAPEWQDLPLLKHNNTKTVVCFAGSEARVLPLENTFRELTGAPPTSFARSDMESTLRHVRYAELYADLLLGVSFANLRPSYLPLTTILDYSAIPYKFCDRDVPVIVHAPSKRSTKGTEIWLKIFDELKAEGHKFKVRLIEDIPHHEMMKVLQHVDILCDGLIHGGKIAREGMAAGCTVLSCFGTNSQGYADFFHKDDNIIRELWNVIPNTEQDRWIKEQYIKKMWYFLPEINPCIPVSPATAKDELREILKNKQKRLFLSKKGRATIEKYCSPAMVAQDIIQCVENPDSFKTQAMLGLHYSLLYDYYIPKNKEEIDIFNRTTEIVRECDWYKRKYSNSSRNGLVF